MGLFEGLSVPARQVLIRATEAAIDMGSREVDGSHLLVGFVDVDGILAGGLLAEVLPHRAALMREVQRGTITGDRTARPMFSEEVALILAAAHGVATARRSGVVGTAECLIAMLTIVPASVEAVLRAFDADVPTLREAALALDHTAEPTVAPSDDAKPWGVAVGGSGRLAWTDEPTS